MEHAQAPLQRLHPLLEAEDVQTLAAAKAVEEANSLQQAACFEGVDALDPVGEADMADESDEKAQSNDADFGFGSEQCTNARDHDKKELAVAVAHMLDVNELQVVMNLEHLELPADHAAPDKMESA